MTVDDELAEGLLNLGAIDCSVLGGDGNEMVVFPKLSIERRIIDGDDPPGFQVFHFGCKLVHLDLGPAPVVFGFRVQIRWIQKHEIARMIVQLENAPVVEVFDDDAV